MPTRPMKLKMAAAQSAERVFMARVATAVAIAFGASVAPETMVTPTTKTMIAATMGLLAMSSSAAAKDRSTCLLENVSRPFSNVLVYKYFTV